MYERGLLMRLPRHGIELELGVPLSRRLKHDEIAAGWRISTLPPGLRWWIAPLAFVPYTLRLLRQQRADLLRGHSILFTGPSLLIARRLARSSVPIVLHHLHSEGRWTWLENAVLRRADAVITISEASRHQLLAARVSPDRIDLVAPGVALPAPDGPWLGSWPGPGLRLLFLSPLIERKRPGIAVEALRLLCDRGVEASLVVAGDGRLRRNLERLVDELGLRNLVAFTGHVSEREKWQLYRAADGLLFPSALEGFGLVAAEAQAAGLAVVAASGTSVSEIVVDEVTGFVVPGTPEAFAGAAERLADPDLRKELGRRGAENARRFDPDDAAAAVAGVYSRVLATALSRHDAGARA